MLNCRGGRYLSFLTAAGRGCRWYSVSLLARREIATSKVKRLVAETACFQPNRGNATKTTPLVLAVMTLFALNVKAGTEERLAACRRQIDTLDQRIVELIQERARVVAEVGDIKREAHLPVTVPGREQQVMEKAQELAKGGPLPAEAVGRIYQKLIEEMRNWEAKPGVATP